MEKEDLGSKKMNNKQTENIDPNLKNQEDKLDIFLKSEVETNENGDQKIVERDRNNSLSDEIIKSPTNKKVSAKPSLASETLGKKMVENQDNNSDITARRFTIPENDEVD